MNKDLYTKIAANVFAVDEQDVTSAMRDVAKKQVYGILYNNNVDLDTFAKEVLTALERSTNVMKDYYLKADVSILYRKQLKDNKDLLKKYWRY